MSTWRVLINPKLFAWKKFIEDRNSRINQSKGRCEMRILPKAGDTILFVIKGRIKFKGIMESDGFCIGDSHRDDPYNIGESRSHSAPDYYAKVKILSTDLDDPIEWKGQRTWAKVK